MHSLQTHLDFPAFLELDHLLLLRHLHNHRLDQVHHFLHSKLEHLLQVATALSSLVADF